MKYLEKGQLLTLDDNKKYIVVDSIIYEDNNFIFIINPEDPKDQSIALISKENDNIKVDTLDYQAEDNKELINTLSDIFLEDIVKFSCLEVDG